MTNLSNFLIKSGKKLNKRFGFSQDLKNEFVRKCVILMIVWRRLGIFEKADEVCFPSNPKGNEWITKELEEAK